MKLNFELSVCSDEPEDLTYLSYLFLDKIWMMHAAWSEISLQNTCPLFAADVDSESVRQKGISFIGRRHRTGIRFSFHIHFSF